MIIKYDSFLLFRNNVWILNNTIQTRLWGPTKSKLLGEIKNDIIEVAISPQWPLLGGAPVRTSLQKIWIYPFIFPTNGDFQQLKNLTNYLFSFGGKKIRCRFFCIFSILLVLFLFSDGNPHSFISNCFTVCRTVKPHSEYFLRLNNKSQTKQSALRQVLSLTNVNRCEGHIYQTMRENGQTFRKCICNEIKMPMWNKKRHIKDRRQTVPAFYGFTGEGRPASRWNLF